MDEASGDSLSAGRGTRDLDDYRSLCGRFNRAAEMAKKNGLQLAYHNHAFEFNPKKVICGFDIMMERFSEDMKFEVDVFWVEVGVEMLQSWLGH